MALFTGSGTALATPFTQDGLDLEGFGRLVDFQLANGTDALIVCGTTGEPPTMTPAEYEQAVDFVVQRTAGRVPVVAGTGSNDTRHAIALCRKAADLGADAALVVTPYYNKST